jgi:hypothetical protein
MIFFLRLPQPPGNEFGRLAEPLQTVAGEYCPSSYPVSQTAGNDKLHSGE